MRFIITGGHSGIGLELSRLLLKDGHKLALIVRNAEREQSARQEFGDSAQIEYFFADLSVQSEIPPVAQQIMAAGPVDGLFNNAGVLLAQSERSK